MMTVPENWKVHSKVEKLDCLMAWTYNKQCKLGYCVNPLSLEQELNSYGTLSKGKWEQAGPAFAILHRRKRSLLWFPFQYNELLLSTQLHLFDYVLFLISAILDCSLFKAERVSWIRATDTILATAVQEVNSVNSGCSSSLLTPLPKATISSGLPTELLQELCLSWHH